MSPMMQIWSERTSRLLGDPGELKEPDSLGPPESSARLVDLGLKSKER